MIISASRRTDIPTHYSEWFMNRVREGYLCVRNPMNARQVSRVSLSPEVVDGIVFWTKNPMPMLEKLGELNAHGYMYYFQFTLNSYGPDVEPNVPSKEKSIIPAFQRLSDQIGPERVIWRYDPIFLSENYTEKYHLRCFERLAKRLERYTYQCTISFLDLYRNTEKNLAPLALQAFPEGAQERIAVNIANIARSFGIGVVTCAEEIALERHGIAHARCIDGELLERLLGCPLKLKKDRNQRAKCGCMESIDIGVYNSCGNGCRYCYANFNPSAVRVNRERHDPNSPFLLGNASPEDNVTDRRMASCKISPNIQLSMFDQN